ncbi:MAG: hypothetical protein KGL53_14925, partial [Elusimicrobia bacterium]|nr:hypothetical protein [Elusimicrobiota bacterium]
MSGARLALGPMLVNFLASNMAAVLLTGLVTGGAVYALYSLGMNAVSPKSASTSVFPADRKAGGPASADAAAPIASGLSYFQAANQGRAYQAPAAPSATGNAPDQAADAPADGSVKDGAKDQPQQADGNAPDLADAFTKAVPKPKMIAARGMPETLGGGNGLAGGAGLAGGMMKKFDPRVDNMKKPAMPLESMHRQVAAKLAARRISAIGNAKGGAMQQLKFSHGMSRQALGATSSEGAAFQAAEAFNTAPAGQGAKAIQGSGIADGSSGVGSTANPDGGPLTSASDPANQGAPSTGPGKNATPYNQALMMAMALLMTASTIITIIGILAIIKKIPLVKVIAETWQKILYGIAIAMAASAAAIGAMVASKYGQQTQGMIVTAGGAITTASATAALMMPDSTSAWVAVLGGIAGMAASVGSLLVPMMQGNALSQGSSTGTGATNQH